MIKVEHLEKTYKSNKKNQTHAIKDVSFTLPDSGMIFIIGKSGSGKSTLLNLIGGLDDFDSGKVIVDGNDLSKMNHTDFNNYRSGYVSFIFQDHFLINELKVKDNVSLGLNVINENNMDRVKDLLEKVDLSNKIDSYPIELSGGERQRVAVARAIIKDPKLILCDEPTGNLDFKTTKLIFDILKELSKEKLVIVVSHDMDNALIYADRIIEIFGGEILSDKTKNNNYNKDLSFDGNSVIIPKNKALDEKDIEYINSIDSKNYKLGEEPYSNTSELVDSNRKVELKKNKFYKGRIGKISKSFIFRNLKKMIVTSIIISVIIACFQVFISLYSFNSSYEIMKNYEKNNVEEILIRRNYYVNENPGDSMRFDKRVYPVSEEDIASLKNNGYEGNVYKVYNYFLYQNYTGIAYEQFYNDSMSLDTFYAKESFGAICCNEDYLKSKFGSIDVIKGDIYEKEGVIITDYMADSLIKNNTSISSYDDIVGRYYYTNVYQCYKYVKAIIKTDYKEVFKDYIDKANKNNGIIIDKNYVNDDEDFGEFSRLIKTKYGLGYSFSTNFIEDNINSKSTGWVPMRFVNIEANGTDFGVVNALSAIRCSESLNHGEAMFNLKYFNTIFNANYSVDDIDSFEPITITIKKYYDDTKQKNSNLYGEVTLKIVKLVNDDSNHDLFIREDDYSLFKDISMIPYGLLLDDVSSSIKCIDDISNGYYISDCLVTNIDLISKYIFIFKKVALLVSIVLAVLIVVYLAFYEMSNISSNKREIGILKAIGMKQRTISMIFIFQQILLSIMVFVTAMLFSYILIRVANNLLQSSIRLYAEVYIASITLIRFRIAYMLVFLALTIVVIMASCIIPILLLTRIKPMNIIKAKE